MSDKILDCSMLSTEAYENIKRGFDMFNGNERGLKYFGCVIKSDLKDLNRNFNYTDKRSFVKGGVVTAGLIWLGSKIKKHFDSKKETAEETVPEEES